MYRAGDLKGPGDGRPIDGRDWKPSKGQTEGQWESFLENAVYLPHSCEEWVIGGVEQIDALMADLKAWRERLVGRRDGD